MIKLDTLLEYQKLDIELRRILDEIERSDYSRKLEQVKAEFATAKNNVNESEKAAGNIVGFYNNSVAFFDDCAKKIDVLEKKLADTEDDAERKEIVSQFEVYRDKLADLEKKLSERRQKAETVIHTYVESQERGKKLRDIYNNTKTKLDAVKAEKEPKIKELNGAMDKLKGSIDKELFEQYKQLTADRKYPALVEAGSTDGGRNFSCNGCGLALSQKAKSELAEKSICRCETCRRIIYRIK